MLSRAPRAPLRLIVFLAWRALGENRVSLVLLLLAVAAGVAFQVPNRANLAGYRGELMRQEVSSGLGHVRVRPRHGERFQDVTDMLAAIRRIPGVEEVDPVLALPGAVSKGGRFVVLGVTGFDPASRHRPYERTAGADLAPGDQHGILLGERLARRLDASVGDDIDVQVLLASRPRLLLDDQGVGSYPLTVRGLVGFAATDAAFVDWSFLAGETGDDHSASALLVRARSGELPAARAIAAAVERAFPAATAQSWLDDSRYLRSAVRAIEAVESIAGGMSLFGVSIPVLALLYIDALHRRRQVSLLSAIGYRSREIFWMFFAKALIVGVAGVAMGAALGFGIVRWFVAHPIYNYEKFVIRPELDAASLAAPMALVLAVTVLAGSLPAWQAAHVDPSDTLRRIE
jgi:ABC-type lipoprotein release transport system permease subunit